jgi:hypothetical protein
MSLVLVDDAVDTFGDLIASCWDATARCSLFVSGSDSIDESISLISKLFEMKYGRAPAYASLHKINSMSSSQTLGIELGG